MPERFPFENFGTHKKTNLRAQKLSENVTLERTGRVRIDIPPIMSDCTVDDGKFDLPDGGMVVVNSLDAPGCKQVDIYKSTSPVPTKISQFKKGSLLKSGGWSSIQFSNPDQSSEAWKTYAERVGVSIESDGGAGREQNKKWYPKPILIGNDFIAFSYVSGTVINVLNAPDFSEVIFERDDFPGQQKSCRLNSGTGNLKPGMSMIATMCNKTSSPNMGWYVIFDSLENSNSQIFNDQLLIDIANASHLSGKALKQFLYHFVINVFYAHFRHFYPDPRESLIQLSGDIAASWTKGLTNSKFFSPPAKWKVIDCDPDI